MKTKLTLKLLWFCLLPAAFCLSAMAQATTFTYQGRLMTNSTPYSGSAEFQFTLWDAVSGGNAVATNNPASLIATVTDGLFTVTLDFGLNPFNGQPRFLQADVRTVIGPFTTLTPRQPVTATPYALRAFAASNLSGTLPAVQLSGQLSGAQLADGAVDAAKVDNTQVQLRITGTAPAGQFITGIAANGSVTVSPDTTDWKLGGNTGTTAGTHFLGTTDNQPVEFKVDGLRVLRLEPTASASPNVVGGSPVNFVATGVMGATISGGGATNISAIANVNSNSILSDFGAIAGGIRNTIDSDQTYDSIGGGFGNEIGGGPGIYNTTGLNGYNSIGGGHENRIYSQARFSTIPGGIGNTIETNASFSSIAGGSANTIAVNSSYGTIGGGLGNTIAANSSFATIPGGESNAATNSAFAAGHRARANHQGAFVWADSQEVDFTSTRSNQFLIRALGGVGIGTASPTNRLHVAGAGSFTNTASAAIMLENTTAVTGRRWEWHALDGGPMQFADFNASATRLLIDTNGNVGIGISNPTNKLHVAGGVSATAFISTSDRNAKENFSEVSPAEVLAKVAALPVQRWTFKDLKDGPHLGPMAQDFYAAFGLGSGETTITTVDADGVALAAIQGLNQKLEERECRLQEELTRRDAENAELKQRLEALERIVRNQKPN